MTIVDLSCPCVTAESACALFNICLNLFLEQNVTTGRVVALDEAHKYMTESPESQTLTESLLATIRLQRHLGARMVIATQEPTISPKLLDLCSVTIVHRFTSPDWLESLKKHLAAARPGLIMPPDRDEVAGCHGPDPLTGLFAKIVSLRQGEALLFCPSALVGVDKSKPAENENGNGNGNGNGGVKIDGFAGWAKSQNDAAGSEEGRDVIVDSFGNSLVRLGCGVMHIRVRERVTEDGGKSVMAE